MKFKIIAITIILLAGTGFAWLTYWSLECINFNTITYDDSEATFLEVKLQKTGKIGTEKKFCKLFLIPAYIRQYD